MANFYRSLAAFAFAGMVLPIINLTMGPPWWFFWPLLFWAFAQIWLACLAFGPTGVADEEWKARKIREELGRDNP